MTTPSDATLHSRRWRFHSNWNNVVLSPAIGAGETEGREARASASATGTRTASEGDAIRTARFHDHWNNNSNGGSMDQNEERDVRVSESATATDGDAIWAARFRGHGSNNADGRSEDQNEERETRASYLSTISAADREAIRAVQNQFEFDARWRQISAFDGRGRHPYWNNGMGEAAVPPGGGDTDDESSQGSRDGEEEATAWSYFQGEEGDDEEIIMVDSMTTQRFPGIRKLFNASRSSSSAARTRNGTVPITST